jgi:hypothetical protein
MTTATLEEKKTVITMEHQKDTANMRVFRQVTDPTEFSIAGDLYLANPWVAQNGSPRKLRVTIEVVG